MAQECYHRTLTPVKGDGREGLPMERYTEETAQQLTEYADVLVRAPPGAGKTLVVPETALSWAGAGGKAWAGAGGSKAVLLTEPTRFAAEKLVESFQKCRKWSRRSIQLVTGAYKDDVFEEGITQLVIATHGMLWTWITSGSKGQQRLAQRFSVVIIDEYAKVPVGRGGTERLQPSVEEMAWVVWKQAMLIGPPSDSRDAWRQRLVLASAKIDPACVRDFFNVPKLGFVNVFARQYTLSRYVVAPMDTGLIESVRGARCGRFAPG